MKYKTTGDIWDTKSEGNVPTVPIATEAMQLKVHGKFTQRQRKLFIFLLHAAWEELETKRLHELKVEEIYRVFNEITGTKSQQWIWEELDQLGEIKITYESPELKAFTRLLSSVKLEKKLGTVKYEIPSGVNDILVNPHTFGKLRTHFLIGLNGKYSVSLYQYLETKINLQKPTIDCELNELKGWLGVGDSYKLWGHFETRVLKPAVNEINENPFSGKFTVRYDLLRGQRKKVTGVRFTLEKDEARKELDNKLQSGKKKTFGKPKAPYSPTEHVITRPFSDDERLKMARDLCTLYGVQKPNKLPLDTKYIAEEWRKWAEKKGEKVNDQVSAYIAFYKMKAEKQGFSVKK